MAAPSVTLAIGGFGFHEYRDDGSETILAPQYRPFIAASSAAMTCHVHRESTPPSDTSGWSLVFDAGPNWTLHQRHNQFLFRTMFFTALCDQELSRCDLFPLSTATESPLSFFSYPLAELITISLLARNDGILLHSCGVEVEGQAFVFCGQSGIGKSTMAAIWQQHGYQILSDDRVIIRRIKNRLVACGTPWHGSAELGTPAILPLAGIYLLGRGNANRLSPINGAHAISLLIQNGFLPFWNKDAMERCLTFFERCIQTIPCASLEFVPDNRIIPFLLSQCAGANGTGTVSTPLWS